MAKQEEKKRLDEMTLQINEGSRFEFDLGPNPKESPMEVDTKEEKSADKLEKEPEKLEEEPVPMDTSKKEPKNSEKSGSLSKDCKGR